MTHHFKATWDRLRTSRISYTSRSRKDLHREAFIQSLATWEAEAFWKMSRKMKRPVLVVLYTRNFPDEKGMALDRVYARAENYTGQIEVMNKIYKLPFENVLAIVRHELGHLADDNFHKGGAEQRADEIVEVATGEKIRYDAKDIQTVGPGRWPRPRHLHR